jgi:hypothetical protein
LGCIEIVLVIGPRSRHGILRALDLLVRVHFHVLNHRDDLVTDMLQEMLLEEGVELEVEGAKVYQISCTQH